MKRSKYMLKLIVAEKSLNGSIYDCIFFCDPKVSGYKHEGRMTRYFAQIKNLSFFGGVAINDKEGLLNEEFVENFTFKKYMQINMVLMSSGKIYNKNMYRHELNNKI